MGVDAATFRNVLGQWPSGVTVVTTLVDGRWHGMTASSFSSVSLDPPLVSVCLAKALWTHGLIEGSGVFAVNILAKDQAPLGMLFAGQRPEVTDRFEGLAARSATTGAPVLADALGWLDCRVRHAYDGGDHTIFVGEVVEAATPRVTAPLLFHSRAWGQFADLLPDDAHGDDTGLVATMLDRSVVPAEVAMLVGAVRDAGVRVRLADLTNGPLTSDHREACGPTRPDPATASVRGSALPHIEDAIELGAGHLDLEVLPTAQSGGPGSLDALAPLIEAARASGLSVGVTIADAFAAVGHSTAERVAAFIDHVVELGPDEITLDDASGSATPLSVRELLQEAVTRAKPIPVGMSLGDQAGLGLANALTAMKSGVRRFEATLGGADGRVALEDLLHLVESLEIASTADRAAVVEAARALEARLGERLPGRTYQLDLPTALPGSLADDVTDLTVRTTTPTAGGHA